MSTKAQEVEAAVAKGLEKKVANDTPDSPSGGKNNILDFFAIKHVDLEYVKDKDGHRKKLGQGGFGVVYQGMWKYGDVAIKELLLNNISDDLVEDFKNEANIMAKLRSDYLVRLSGYCLSPRYCLVLEYMPGGSLYSLLQSKQPLDWGVRSQISMDIVRGLAYLHSENILHRDIKSLNVLLDKHQGAKLTDFGLSRIKHESKSSTAGAGSVGTTLWMAPELFKRNAKYTQKSDVYSLGITLWEIAARKRPFSDAHDPAVVPGWVTEGERDEIPKDCPKKMGSLISVCWQGKPEDRPTAVQIVQYLQSTAEDYEQFVSGNQEKKEPNVGQSSASESSYLGNQNSLLLQKTGYLGNQNSMANASSSAEVSKSTVTVIPEVKPKDVQTFLDHVVWGREDEAEKMLKENTELALVSGDVTDTAGRTFKNITGFQYAVWALDWKMWEMIKSHLSSDVQREQAKGFTDGAWVKEHKEHAEWKTLLDALQTYVDALQTDDDYDQCEKYWVGAVGGAQRQLPVHVLQEYNNPDRPFNPTPKFDEKYSLVRTLPDWLVSPLNDKKDFDFGIFRRDAGGCAIFAGARTRPRFGVPADRISLVSLYDTRTQQRSKLVADLARANKPGAFKK